MTELPIIIEGLDAATFKPNAEGMFFGLPQHVYREAPGENVSALKFLAESPLKYRYAQDHPKKQTPAMSFGTIVHCIALGEDKLEDVAVLRPAKWDSFRTKEAREWKDAQTAIILSEGELAEMTAVADSIKADPNCAWVLSRAQKEVAIFKRHERTGLLLKARLDLPFMDQEEKLAVADIKKTTSIDKHLFAKSIGIYSMHVAGSFYRDIIGASSFFWMAVEESAPHEVCIYKQSEGSYERGRAIYERWLDILVDCRARNEWPSRFNQGAGIEEIEEPAWAQWTP